MPDYPINPDSVDDKFDEETLKNIIACALLMSSIDGEVHEKEWRIIKDFADEHWKEEYSDFGRFQKSAWKEIRSLFDENKKFQMKLNELVGKLTYNLNSHQKNTVLNLIGDVMIADGVMTLEESKLFATFMEKLGIRIS